MPSYSFKWSTPDADDASIVVRNGAGTIVATGTTADVVAVTNEAFVTYTVDLPAGDTYTATATVLGRSRSTVGVLDTSAATLSASFAGIKQARMGNLFVFLGDSTTLGSDDNVSNARGDCWPVYASIMSQQQIRYVRNAGGGGDTTAQMLARFDTDVTPYAPNVVTLLCGTNDTGVTDLATWMSQVQAIVAKIRAIGAKPILCTMVPNIQTTPTVDRRTLVLLFNEALRAYAAKEQIDLLDFYNVLVDPATGGFLAAYLADGKHPNAAGAAAMASYAWTILSKYVPAGAPQVCQDDVDETNSLYKGCFTGYTGSTVPTGWVDNAGVPAGSVLSYTTDAAVKGQMVTITSTATAGVRQLAFTVVTAAAVVNTATTAGATTISITVNPTTRGVLFIGSGATAEVAKASSVSGSGTTWTVTLTRALKNAHAAGEAVIVNGTTGDKMRYTGVITSDGGVTAKCAVVPNAGTGSAIPMSALSRPITRGVWSGDSVLTATSSPLSVRLEVGAGTGVTSFGQVGLYNVTRNGWVL